tara:strand:- start:55 stop:498 length:444 start_codon:yes stop_codon:yes gene_type:complete
MVTIVPLFLINHLILFTHIVGIKKNHIESAKILEIINQKNELDNLILDDFNGLSYFRRYSTKFHSLPNFIYENLIDRETNVITSANRINEKEGNKTIISLDDGQFKIANEVKLPHVKRHDKYTINMFGSSLGYSYQKSQIYLWKNKK